MGVFKEKPLRSNPKNFAPGVDTTLLRSSLIMGRQAVGVPQSMLMFILSPPNARRDLFGLTFSGLTLHNILLYVTSFHLLSGTPSL